MPCDAISLRPRRIASRALAMWLMSGCTTPREPVPTTKPLSSVPSSAPDAPSGPLTATPDRTTDPSLAVKRSPLVPVLAVWRQSHGHVAPSLDGAPRGPALRAAVWEDGRVVFASQWANLWGDLREGKLEPSRVATLLEAAAKTGVFELRGQTYLVPDGPVLVTLVRGGGKEKILYWDEVETANYGINVAPKPHHLAFKKVWHDLNRLLREALPSSSYAPVSRADAAAPSADWYIAPAIQSE